MKTYKQYLNESPEQIDYDNDSFEKIWSYETSNPKIKSIDSIEDEIAKWSNINGVFYSADTESIEYLKNGLHHREDGPAVIDYNGSMGWYINGDMHREDGPAYISRTKPKRYIWKVNGKEYNGNTNVPENIQWVMVKYDPKNIDLIPNPTKEIQEFIIINHPEYINDLKHIDNDIKQKYSHIIAGEDLGI